MACISHAEPRHGGLFNAIAASAGVEVRLMRTSCAVLSANGLLATKFLSTMHHGVASRIFALEERFRDLLVRLLTSMVLVLR